MSKPKAPNEVKGFVWCPYGRSGAMYDYTRREIEREGERAQSSRQRRYDNPYPKYGDYEEQEQRDFWDRGYRRAERREEERCEEERADEARAARAEAERGEEACGEEACDREAEAERLRGEDQG